MDRGPGQRLPTGGDTCIPTPGAYSGHAVGEVPMDCRCGAEKIGAVHAYLNEHFPGHAVDDFHTTSRLAQRGIVAGYADHHVVRVTASENYAYHTILLHEFLEYPLNEFAQCLQDGDLAATLRAHRTAVVSTDGVSAL